MKTFTQNHARNIGRAALVATALTVGMTSNAFAVQQGTVSGTDISNIATVNFTTGGVPQTEIPSNITTFKVGKKINLSLVEDNSTFTTVAAGGLAQSTEFTLTNLGNDSQSFNLSALDLATSTVLFGGTDTFDVTAASFKYYAAGVEILAVGGFYIVPTLASGDSVALVVTADIPADRVDGDQAVISLTAATTVPGSSTLVVATGTGVAFDNTVVQIVFADPGVDASETAQDAYRLITAALTVVKSTAVYWDPGSLYVNPKAIPGAILTYTITVTNGGSAEATLVSIADALAGKPVTFNPQYLNGAAGATTCGATEGILIDGLCSSNADDLDNAKYVGTTVTGDFASIAAAGTAIVKFQVTVN